MKQIIFQVTSMLTIVCNLESDFCQILKHGVPIWCGNHLELIDTLEKAWNLKTPTNNAKQ